MSFVAIVRQIESWARDHQDDAETCAALVAMAKGLGVKDCQVCGGWGHYSPSCATKKAMDAAVKAIPMLKVVWGSIKGSQKQKYQMKKVINTQRRLVSDLEEEVKKLEQRVDAARLTEAIVRPLNAATGSKLVVQSKDGKILKEIDTSAVANSFSQPQTQSTAATGNYERSAFEEDTTMLNQDKKQAEDDDLAIKKAASAQKRFNQT